jgi:hypothetical protein
MNKRRLQRWLEHLDRLEHDRKRRIAMAFSRRDSSRRGYKYVTFEKGVLVEANMDWAPREIVQAQWGARRESRILRDASNQARCSKTKTSRL